MIFFYVLGTSLSVIVIACPVWRTVGIRRFASSLSGRHIPLLASPLNLLFCRGGCSLVARLDHDF